MMTITISGALEAAVMLLLFTSCIYTSLAMIVSAIEHIQKFRKNNKTKQEQQ